METVLSGIQCENYRLCWEYLEDIMDFKAVTREDSREVLLSIN